MSYANWCFTLNNYHPGSPLTFSNDVKGCVWQAEQGSLGTPHLQGYIQFKKKMSLLQVKKVVGLESAHWENRKGSHKQALQYCIKEDTRVNGPWYHGDINLSTGKRNDLDTFVQEVKSGMTETDSFDLFPSVHARFPRFVSSTYERFRVSLLPLSVFEPRSGWQSDLGTVLSQEPNPRTIIWIYDSVGNLGKSYFANNYSNAYVITGGKNADVYFAYHFEKYVFFGRVL
nr:MAG: replication associated protein [Cressdnaviricota sp.]